VPDNDACDCGVPSGVGQPAVNCQRRTTPYNGSVHRSSVSDDDDGDDE
jgi:hypothetical protein